MRDKLLPLTSMRFFAAFFVLLSHLSFVRDDDSYLFFFVEDGFIGVTFFFILSGFILSYSYEERLLKNNVSKERYFIARIARIYPLHILTLLISLPFVIYGGLNSILASAPNLLLLHSWIPVKSIYFSANYPSWSISTELLFYLVFPFLAFFKTRVLMILVLSLISLQAIGLSLGFGEEIDHAIFYISPFSRISDFMLGIIIYRLFVLSPEISKSLAGSFQFVSILLLVLFIYIGDICTIDIQYKFSLFYIVPMALIIFSFAFNGGALGKLLSNKYLVLLGESSFALYMIHQLVIRYLTTINSKLEWLSVGQLLCVIFIVTLSSSVLLFKYFEIPTRNIVIAYLSKHPWITGKSPLSFISKIRLTRP